MEDPKVYHNKPLNIHLKAGKYWWCACGHSRRHPHCDGSHKDTGIKPVRFELKEDQDLWLCNCKKTNKPPYCDGTHNDIQNA